MGVRPGTELQMQMITLARLRLHWSSMECGIMIILGVASLTNRCRLVGRCVCTLLMIYRHAKLSGEV